MMDRSNMQEFSVFQLVKIELYEQNIIHQTQICVASFMLKHDC